MAQITMRTRKTKLWLIIPVTMLLTVFGTVLFINLSSGEKQIHYEISHEFAVEDPQFLRSMGALLGQQVLPGNRITSLQNGDEIFPAMLAAIRDARETITLETYIYWSGEIGLKFSDALCERAKDGVKVHVILDAVGCGKIDADYLEKMKAAGVQIENFHPLKWHSVTRINNRTHRKLLVIDGRVGFTGGVGIADAWSGNADASDHWRDSHYQLEGPAVAQMQAVFCENWIRTRGKVLVGSAYFPKLKPVGDSSAQMFKSSPVGDSENVRLMYLLSIASATKSIRLQAAYFVPDELAIRTFVAACKRGVKVEIIVPGPHTDSEIVADASRALWGELLDAGVEIHEYQPAMYHCKVIIVDDIWVSIGSTNFDDRSFRLNHEANLNVYDAEFAAEQVTVFDADKAKSRRMTRAEFKDRSAAVKLWDRIAVSLRRQL
jgi:cardiolipin synthase